MSYSKEELVQLRTRLVVSSHLPTTQKVLSKVSRILWVTLQNTHTKKVS